MTARRTERSDQPLPCRINGRQVRITSCCNRSRPTGGPVCGGVKSAARCDRVLGPAAEQSLCVAGRYRGSLPCATRGRYSPQRSSTAGSDLSAGAQLRYRAGAHGVMHYDRVSRWERGDCGGQRHVLLDKIGFCSPRRYAFAVTPMRRVWDAQGVRGVAVWRVEADVQLHVRAGDVATDMETDGGDSRFSGS